MKRPTTSHTLLPFLAFLCSVLVYLLTGLFYSHGIPFRLFLPTYGYYYRVLLAIEVYFLSCAAFFSARVLSVGAFTRLRFSRTFWGSFLPVLVFSSLVTLQSSLQNLRAFVYAADVLVWLYLVVLLYHLESRGRMSVQLRRVVYTSLGFLFLFFVSGILLFLPIFSSGTIVLFRLAFLAFYSVFSFVLIPADEAMHLNELVHRYRLSPRESEILALLLEGRTNEEIAATLFISLSTVKTHLASVFRKTGARNRLHVVSKCAGR